jgi:hypothetical protein
LVYKYTEINNGSFQKKGIFAAQRGREEKFDYFTSLIFGVHFPI